MLFALINTVKKYFPCVSKTFPVLQQNSLCFPCLEKVRTKFPVFLVPWPPIMGDLQRMIQGEIFTAHIRRMGEGYIFTLCVGPHPPAGRAVPVRATRRAVCLLRSRRRTFLFNNKIACVELHASDSVI